MPAPRLHDDGRTVVLDLHGARVDESERLVRSAVALAARRGRSTLRVVHGHSTSDAAARNDTIKHRVYALLDGGALAPWVTSAVRAEGHTLLGLTLAPRRDPTPLRFADLSR